MADSADATSAEMGGRVVVAAELGDDEEFCAGVATDAKKIRAKKQAKSLQRDTNNLNQQFNVPV